MRGIEAQHAEAPLQIEHLLLRGLHLVLEIVELPGEPLGDALRGQIAGLIAALDIVGHHPVDDVSREFGVEAGVGELDDVGLRNERDLELPMQAADRLLTHAGRVQRLVGNRPTHAEEVRVVAEVHLARHGHHQRVALQDDDLSGELAVGIAAEPLNGVDLVLGGGSGANLDLGEGVEQLGLRVGSVDAVGDPQKHADEQDQAVLAQRDQRIGERGVGRFAAVQELRELPDWGRQHRLWDHGGICSRKPSQVDGNVYGGFGAGVREPVAAGRRCSTRWSSTNVPCSSLRGWPKTDLPASALVGRGPIRCTNVVSSSVPGSSAKARSPSRGHGQPRLPNTRLTQD